MKFNTHKKKLINRFLLWPPTHRDDSIEFWRKKKLNPFFRNVRTETKEGVNARALQKKKILSACAAFMKFFCRVPTWSKFTLFFDSNKSYTCDEDRCNPCIFQQKLQQPVYVPPFYSFLFLGSKKRWTGYRQPLQETADGVKSGSGFFFFSTEKEK